MTPILFTLLAACGGPQTETDDTGTPNTDTDTDTMDTGDTGNTTDLPESVLAGFVGQCDLDEEDLLPVDGTCMEGVAVLDNDEYLASGDVDNITVRCNIQYNLDVGGASGLAGTESFNWAHTLTSDDATIVEGEDCDTFGLFPEDYSNQTIEYAYDENYPLEASDGSVVDTPVMLYNDGSSWVPFAFANQDASGDPIQLLWDSLEIYDVEQSQRSSASSDDVVFVNGAIGLLNDIKTEAAAMKASGRPINADFIHDLTASVKVLEAERIALGESLSGY